MAHPIVLSVPTKAMSPPGEMQVLLDAIRQLVRSLRLSDGEISRELGISAAQLFVLQQLQYFQPMSLSDLAAATFTDHSSVSAVVSRLVDRDLVSRERADDDARRLELRLTAAGRALLRKAPSTAQERLIDAIAHLPSRRRQELAESLQMIVAEIGLTGAAPMFFEEGERK
ncbi:MAG: MarR family winged helix-turn-helix transcriptional regulator [Thermoanaerobaculia bacterium]